MRFSHRFSAPLPSLARAFTLLELLAVVAIIAIVGALALPAYNNYVLKSRFSEVIVATSPIKSFISSCAQTGDCVSGDVILMPMDRTTSLAQQTLAPPMLAFATAMLNQCGTYGGVPSTFSTGAIQHFVDQWNDPTTGFTVIVDPSNNNDYCMTPTVGSHTRCADVCTTPDHVHHFTGPATMFGSDYVSTGTPRLVAPCVGSGAGCSPSTKYVSLATSDNLGVITAQAVSGFGLGGSTVILTPAYSSGRVDWLMGGSCKTRDGGAIC